MPKRIQRLRIKGWKMPLNAIYVGRPTRFGNPYTVKEYGDAASAVSLFKADQCSSQSYRRQVRAVLRGKDLACWCPLDQPCHADVLLKIANG